MAKIKHAKLSEFFSTAIAGNNIFSSTLYVSGIAILYAGVYAPWILFAVALVLFLYRTVYREVVEAIPVNGGAYNALLNSTSKPFAALAGVMTILSYIATAVISSMTAVQYLFLFFEKIATNQLGITLHLNNWVLLCTLLLLLAFAMLVISGVEHSARLSAVIFVFHIVTLLCLLVFGVIYFFAIQPEMLSSSLSFHNLTATQNLIHQRGFTTILFFAFSASLLGISGFDSSANFVEEQKPGVFRKTLRNMTIGVMFFNPLIAYLILKLLTYEQISVTKDFLLADAAGKIGGLFLLGWIAVDAFLVLAGAVLTSYIGVSGLITRMAFDQCLPASLINKKHPQSKTRIIVLFFLLCASILLLTNGDLLSLAGVYTISFLGVMSLFAIGNLVLRKTRPELKRPYTAPFMFVLIALFSTLAGLFGNIALSPKNTQYFLLYFIPAMFITLCVVFQKDLLRTLRKTFFFIKPLHDRLDQWYFQTIHNRVYVFVHESQNLFQILQYIHKNESGHFVTIIHCQQSMRESKHTIQHVIPCLHAAGVFPHLNIDFEFINKPFGPEVINSYATKHHIDHSKIFIGSIKDYHNFEYAQIGGVRIIL